MIDPYADELRNRAADELESRSLCKGALARDADGFSLDFLDGSRAAAFCTWGALSWAAHLVHPEWDRRDLHSAADFIVGDILEELGVDSIGEWNDDPERTKEEVVAALRPKGD